MRTRTTVLVAGAVERTPTHTRSVLLVAVEEVVEHDERQLSLLLGDCDLCAEHGITNPAAAEARMPGGAWASLCRSHAYRARSAGLRVVGDEAEGERRVA